MHLIGFPFRVSSTASPLLSRPSCATDPRSGSSASSPPRGLHHRRVRREEERLISSHDGGVAAVQSARVTRRFPRLEAPSFLFCPQKTCRLVILFCEFIAFRFVRYPSRIRHTTLNHFGMVFIYHPKKILAFS